MHEIRVLVLTPLALEYHAIARHLANCQHYVHEKAAYTAGTFAGHFHSYKVLIREPGPLPVEMALATDQAIQHFNPQIALLVGVAGGLKDVAIGDVLIADKVYSYEGGKEDKDGFKARPAMGFGSKDLLAYAQIMNKSEDWKARTQDKAPGARVFFGPIASGSKVVAGNDNQTYQSIKKHFNDSLGVEMEAYGFCAALQFHPEIHGLVVRGISDLCEGKVGASDERWQPLAAERASAVAFELLHQMDCSKFITKKMDAKSLSKEIFELLFPLPASIQEVGSDFANSPNKEAAEIWKRVKPLFFNEVEEMRKDPTDSDAQADVRNKLKKELDGREDLMQELASILKKSAEKNQDQSVSVVGSKNVIANSKITVGGDFRLGDG